MKQRTLDEMISYFDQQVLKMDIKHEDKIKLLGMITAIGYKVQKHEWIPCSERLPEEDYWLGGSGRQFSDEVLISVENRDDEDAWVYISQTIDGKWILELPRHCEITAWMPLPEPWKEGEAD